jgi:hypothetical protein
MQFKFHSTDPGINAGIVDILCRTQRPLVTIIESNQGEGKAI